MGGGVARQDTIIILHVYFLFRSGAIEKGLKTVYPSYNSLREQKNKCLPTSIDVTDFSASINLQDLMNHTGKGRVNFIFPIHLQLQQPFSANFK